MNEEITPDGLVHARLRYALRHAENLTTSIAGLCSSPPRAGKDAVFLRALEMYLEQASGVVRNLCQERDSQEKNNEV